MANGEKNSIITESCFAFSLKWAGLTFLLLVKSLPDSLSMTVEKNSIEDKLLRFVTFPFYNKSLFGLKISDALILFCEILLQTRSNHA